MLLKVFGIAIVGILLALVADQIYQFGFHVHHFKHHPGMCKRIEGIDFGSEDFEVLSNGQTFITSGVVINMDSPGYLDFVQKNKVRGRVFLLDFENPKHAVKELKLLPSADFDPKAFGPHGISVLEDKIQGEHLLYTVSHVRGKPDRIEKFKYLPKTQELQHLKSFFSDLLHLSNDILVVSEDKFYVTNFLYYENKFLAVFETFFRLPFGNVVYYDGSDFTVATSGHYAPNGVALSKDGRLVYIITSHNKGISVFDRLSNGSLHLIQYVHIGVMADNIHLSADGRTIYAGCHPIKWKTFKHFFDPTEKCPSMVISLGLSDDGLVLEDEINQLFYDHGDLISASSIANVYENRLLIGSVLDKLVLCDLISQRENVGKI